MRESDGFKGKGGEEWKEMTFRQKGVLKGVKRWRECAAVNPLRLITQLLGDQQPAAIHPSPLRLFPSVHI